MNDLNNVPSVIMSMTIRVTIFKVKMQYFTKETKVTIKMNQVQG